MYDWRQISDMEYRISLAKVHAPKDILTKTAIVLVKVLTGVLIVLVPLEIVTTALGGCLITVTFGVLIFVLTLIWWPFLMVLLSTSWLWLRAWYLRPILLVPGVLVSTLADLYVMLAPDPDKAAKNAKLAIAGEWPLSWYLIKPPAEYYEGDNKKPTQEEINQQVLEASHAEYEREQAHNLQQLKRSYIAQGLTEEEADKKIGEFLQHLHETS